MKTRSRTQRILDMALKQKDAERHDPISSRKKKTPVNRRIFPSENDAQVVPLENNNEAGSPFRDITNVNLQTVSDNITTNVNLPDVRNTESNVLSMETNRPYHFRNNIMTNVDLPVHNTENVLSMKTNHLENDHSADHQFNSGVNIFQLDEGTLQPSHGDNLSTFGDVELDTLFQEFKENEMCIILPAVENVEPSSVSEINKRYEEELERAIAMRNGEEKLQELVDAEDVPHQTDSDSEDSAEVDDDYVPNDDDYEPDEDDVHESAEFLINETTSQDIEVAVDGSPPKRKRARKGHAQPDLWIPNRNQKLREKGLAYNGVQKTKSNDEAKEKQKYCTPRKERQMGARCKCKPGKSEDAIRKCYKITDEYRSSVFNEFWREMDWSAKKALVKALVTRSQPKDLRHRKKETGSRRKNTLNFHMRVSKEDADIGRVCRTMFLATYGLKQWTVLNWTLSPYKHIPTECNRRKIVSEERRNVVKEFINCLPKMESHYCRKDTSKLYLEPIWESMTHIHMEFKNWCAKNSNLKPVQYKVFYDVLMEMKIAIFSPRKDQCDFCLGYTNKNPDITVEMYNEHIKRKDEAREAMQKDVDSEENRFVFTMDVEAVLICPKSKASAAYYRSKMVVHNWTIFNSKNQVAFCNLWDESEANLQASVFATFITKHIEKEVAPNEDVILWSDGCNYQNRNCILANALVNLAMKRKTCITQKFLEKGRTQMQCDSMHAQIEKKVKKREIHLPSAYIPICEAARRDPEPYNVRYWYHDDFQDFTKLKFYSSIRPGHKEGDPCVVDLRALRYEPDGKIFYKSSHSGEWIQMQHRTRQPLASKSVPRLFQNRLKITDKKWNDIQALKSVLPRDTHSF